MTISQHVSEITLEKAMSLNTFLVFMHKRDQDLSHFETGGDLAIELAEEAGNMCCVSASFVYSIELIRNGGKANYNVKNN